MIEWPRFYSCLLKSTPVNIRKILIICKRIIILWYQLKWRWLNTDYYGIYMYIIMNSVVFGFAFFKKYHWDWYVNYLILKLHIISFIENMVFRRISVILMVILCLCKFGLKTLFRHATISEIICQSSAYVTLWRHVRMGHKWDPSFSQRTVDRCAQFRRFVH